MKHTAACAAFPNPFSAETEAAGLEEERARGGASVEGQHRSEHINVKPVNTLEERRILQLQRHKTRDLIKDDSLVSYSLLLSVITV